jgi:hypothetical protein
VSSLSDEKIHQKRLAKKERPVPAPADSSLLLGGRREQLFQAVREQLDHQCQKVEEEQGSEVIHLNKM